MYDGEVLPPVYTGAILPVLWYAIYAVFAAAVTGLSGIGVMLPPLYDGLALIFVLYVGVVLALAVFMYVLFCIAGVTLPLFIATGLKFTGAVYGFGVVLALEAYDAV